MQLRGRWCRVAKWAGDDDHDDDDDDDDDDERMNFNMAYVLRLQGHVTRRNNSEVTW